MALTYSFIQQSVIASLVATAKNDDSFFNPVLLNHTGFAYDGYQYEAGVQQTAQASWFLEQPSDTRGAAQFPTDLLVVLSEASLSLLDSGNQTVKLWMLFYYMDQGAFPNNFSTQIASFSPKTLSWGNGLLTVTSGFDPGSPFSPYAALTIDFVNDQAYIDYSVS